MSSAPYHRRTFLKTALTGATMLALPTALVRAAASETEAGAQGATPIQLSIVSRTIEVNGRAAKVFGIRQPNGTPGLRINRADGFNVVLKNELPEPTSLHWHGLTPPWPQDGVPNAPLAPLPQDASHAFSFPLDRPGTYWMHAHTLQEQQLLAAPLIVTDPADEQAGEQEVVLFLHDFSFRTPQELLASLSKGHASMNGMMDMPGMDMSDHDMPGMKMSMDSAMDLNDIDYDAYLANDRTLDDPEVTKIEAGGQVRVRVINAAAGTAFTIDLGALTGTLIAVDGQPVRPVTGRRFPVSMAQRVDIRLRLPAGPGAYPVLALREGAVERTGIVLQAGGAQVAKLATHGKAKGPVLSFGMESQLRAVTPLAVKRPDETYLMTLSGDMATYRWKQAIKPAFEVSQGHRVEVTMRNASMMSHPMHLHGHHFQVVAVDGRRFQGAVRDTVLVPPMRSVTIAVDALNPGQWAFHCHNLYHMESGMMSTFAYRA